MIGPPNPTHATHSTNRDTPTHNRQTTQSRWHRLAEDLARLATDPDFDAARERVGLLVVREALALGVSSEIEGNGSSVATSQTHTYVNCNIVQ